MINKPAICTSKSVFQSTKKLSVYNINKHQTVIFVYKTLHNLSPTCFQNLFKLLSNVHSHNTRAEGKNNLFAQNAKHTLRKFALSVRAPTLWNSIPSFIRDADTLSLFSKNIKLFFLNSPEGTLWWDAIILLVLVKKKKKKKKNHSRKLFLGSPIWVPKNPSPLICILDDHFFMIGSYLEWPFHKIIYCVWLYNIYSCMLILGALSAYYVNEWFKFSSYWVVKCYYWLHNYLCQVISNTQKEYLVLNVNETWVYIQEYNYWVIWVAKFWFWFHYARSVNQLIWVFGVKEFK